MEKLAQALLERETLSIDEIDVLLGRKDPDPEPEQTAETAEPESAESEDDGAGTAAGTEADL